MTEYKCPYKQIFKGELVCRFDDSIQPMDKCSPNCVILNNLPLCKYAKFKRTVFRSSFDGCNPEVKITCSKYLKTINFNDCKKCKSFEIEPEYQKII